MPSVFVLIVNIDMTFSSKQPYTLILLGFLVVAYVITRESSLAAAVAG